MQVNAEAGKADCISSVSCDGGEKELDMFGSKFGWARCDILERAL